MPLDLYISSVSRYANLFLSYMKGRKDVYMFSKPNLKIIVFIGIHLKMVSE